MNNWIWILTRTVEYEEYNSFISAWKTKPSLNALKNVMDNATPNHHVKTLKKTGYVSTSWGTEYNLIHYKLTD